MSNGDGDGGRTSVMDRRVSETAGFTPQFEIELGHVQVEDKESNREFVQWKAKLDGDEVVSDSPTDAVMGVVFQATDGEL